MPGLESVGTSVLFHTWLSSSGGKTLEKNCLFKAIHSTSSHLALPHFTHNPSTSFLYAFPAAFASRNGSDVGINTFIMDPIFGKLLISRLLVISSVYTLQVKLSLSKDKE